jgi:CubicO group peptidase (beta-lactamase class C family)
MELRHGTPEEAGVSSLQVEKIKTRARGWIDAGLYPTLVILAARRGVILLHEAYGAFGPEEGSHPLGTKTIFPLASLTKPFTASVAMTLVEEGRIGLNRPVHEYLPEFHGDGKGDILIHHLLTHTSGIEDEEVYGLVRQEHPELDDPSVPNWLVENLDQWIAFSGRLEPKTAPGEIMMYADTNFELLAEVIKRVSLTSLEDAARERIFEPLGMKDTYYNLPDELFDRVVLRPESAPFIDAEMTWRKSPSGSAGLFSTATDLAAFGQMLLNLGAYGDSRVLSPASVRAMTQDQIPGVGARVVDRTFPYASWGLGWSITAPYKGPLYGEQMLSLRSFVHGGAGGVFFWADPARDALGVYLSVTMTEAQRMTKGFADLFINMVVASIEEE